jgi:ligand-binding sensor domain-containing protein
MRAVSACKAVASIWMGVCAGASLNAQTYAYQSYGAKAGIAVANAIAFDPDGALVAGTNDGIVRFDGVRFEPVPLPGVSQARIVRITAGPDSSLWIQTDAGGLFHLAREDRISRVSVPTALATELAAYRTWQRLRVDAAGHVWTNGWGPGLWRFDPATTRWSQLAVSGGENIVDFFFEGRELLWLASGQNVGRIALTGENVTAPDWSPVGKRILFMRPHSPGHAWVGTEAGVYVLSSDGSMRPALGVEYAAGRNAEPDVDASGRLLATIGAKLPDQGRRTGVMRLAASGGVEFPQSVKPALDEFLPRQLLFGREGDFWLAHEGGLIHVDQEYLVSYPVRAPNGPAEFLTGLTDDSLSKSLWISTWGGMYRLHDQRVERMSDLTRRATTRATPSHDGRVWWREYGDLGFTAGNGSRAVPTEGSDHLVYETRAGVRFVARKDGVYRTSGQLAVRISARRFISAYVAEASGGRIWMAPISSVLTRLDTVEGDSLGTECRACLPSSLRTVLDTLRSLNIVDMAADAFGRVWIAAGRSGLICVYQTGKGEWGSQRLQTTDGPPER